MEIKIFKPVLCGAVLLGSLSVTFGAVQASSNIPVTDPGFGFSLTGLYLQPDASNLEYAVYTQPVPVSTPNWEQKNISTGYHPAFDLGLEYTLATGVDQVKLDWLHLDSSDKSSGSASGDASIAPWYYFGPPAQAMRGTYASGKAEFDVDNANLVFDHLLNIGRYLQLEPFAGLNAAYLKQDMTDKYTGTHQATGGDYEPYSITSYYTSKFVGAGPRIGLDATAYVFHHFGILAEMGASLLLGSMKSDTSFDSYGDGNTTTAHTKLADQSLMRIVPELDSRLGLTYEFDFHSGSSLELEAGYKFAVYFNGINQVFPTALVPDAFQNGVIAIESSEQNQSNLDLNGPYLKLAYRF